MDNQIIADNIEQDIRNVSNELSDMLVYENVINEFDSKECFELIYNHLYKRYFENV